MTHDRLALLYDLLALARESALDAPAEKRAPLLAQANQISEKIYALESERAEKAAKADDGDGVDPGRGRDPNTPRGSVTPLDAFREAVGR